MFEKGLPLMNRKLAKKILMIFIITLSHCVASFIKHLESQSDGKFACFILLFKSQFEKIAQWLIILLTVPTDVGRFLKA